MIDILKEARTILRTTPQRWIYLTENVSAELLYRAPAPNEWSAYDCLQHLVDAERWVFPTRVNALLAGQDFPAFDPDGEGVQPYGELSPVELAAEFAALRKESLVLFDQLTNSDLVRAANHQFLGQATMSELLHEWPAHDLNHTVQAERALMQPFIQGTGPWQSLFKDHFVDAPVPAQ